MLRAIPTLRARPWELRDVFVGILERDELAATGQRDRFVEASGPGQ